MPAATAHPSMSYMPQSPLFNSALPRHNMTHFNYAPPRTQNAMFYQPGNPQTSPSYGGWNPQNNNHNGSQSGPQYSFYGHDGSNIQGMSPRFHNTFASTKGQVFDTGFNQPHRRKVRMAMSLLPLILLFSAV
uniref:Uncharacterized protein n=1 Tax=Arion vulgaris TaxID=1028688 RepID=A0A0B7AHE1_9EUPU